MSQSARSSNLGVNEASPTRQRIALSAGIASSFLYTFACACFAATVVSFVYSDGALKYFLAFGTTTLAVGVLCTLVHRSIDSSPDILRARHGFLIVALAYLFVGLVGAMPFWLIPDIASNFTDAAFESFSGLTTTGATTFVGLDNMPESVLFYRQVLQWLGGMGIIVLAIAVLPMLGIGGTQLFKAESPGTTWDNPLSMRVKDTAKQYWILYTGLTLLCASAYWLAGMSLFDAVCHSFSTIAIGGFSTHDQSIGYFDSVAIESVAIVFMIVAGLNFAVHYFALHPRATQSSDRDNQSAVKLIYSSLKSRINSYWEDEPRSFFLMLFLVAVPVILYLFFAASDSVDAPLRVGLFQSISFATTTGYTTTDYQAWPIFCPALLLFAAFVGGCNGSTSGGIKIYRLLLLVRQGTREVSRLIYPNAILHVQLNNRSVSDDVVESVWGFIAVYASCFVVFVLLLLATTDLEFVSAWSAAAACLNNLGPGLGEVALNYTAVPAPAKWVLIIAMVLGRLEIFTVLVLFAPRYWKH